MLTEIHMDFIKTGDKRQRNDYYVSSKEDWNNKRNLI